MADIQSKLLTNRRAKHGSGSIKARDVHTGQMLFHEWQLEREELTMPCPSPLERAFELARAGTPRGNCIAVQQTQMGYAQVLQLDIARFC